MSITERILSARGALIALAFAGLSLCQLAVVPHADAALIILPSPPPSVLPGAIQSQTDATIFLESTTTLGAALGVDISVPGFYTPSNPDSPGAIPALTPVNSYFLHHESVDFKLSTVTVGGTFPNPVLGIIVNDVNLDLTDPILGSGSTLYPTGLANRGLEIPALALFDLIAWNGNQVTIVVQSTTALVLDQIRIITAVPEPSTLALGLVAAPLAWVFRKRFRRRS